MTLKQIVKIALQINELNNVPNNIIYSFKLNKEDKNKLYGLLLDYNIEHEYYKIDDKNNYYQFKLLGLLFIIM